MEGSGSGTRSDSITRIERKYYEAAVEGNFDEFMNVENVERLLTPTKNTVLHIHLTSRTSQTGNRPYVEDKRWFFHLIWDRNLDHAFPIPHVPPVSEQFVKQIVDKCEVLVLLRNAKGETPLHIAARYGHSTIAKFLIERAKDIENGIIGAEKKFIQTVNGDKDTALHEAVRYQHNEVAQILLEMDPDHSYYANDAGETPLYLAAERRYKGMVTLILEKSNSPAYDGPNCRTALHAAVINCDIEMVEDLLGDEHVRAATKHADEKGWVPLHYAVEMGHKDLTMLLLKKDESTAYMQDNEGRTALHIAAYSRHSFIVKMILRNYPDCSELVDNNGWNALHFIVNCKYYSKSTLRTIFSIITNLSLSNLYNEKDARGNTPLHLYATGNNIGLGIFLRQPRLDKLAVNKNHQTALDIACDPTNIFGHHSLQSEVYTLEEAGVVRSQRKLEREDLVDLFYDLEFTKEAKESHMIMATLIATVSFAAGITLPGGSIQDGENKGSPILRHRGSFKAFMVANTAALVLSASAAFIHLCSLMNKNRRTKVKDSYFSEIAFSFTVVAVAAMVVAFATGTYAVLGSSSIGIAIITLGLAFFLVFRKVLKMAFTGDSLLLLTRSLTSVILFFFMELALSRYLVYIFLLFEGDQSETPII